MSPLQRAEVPRLNIISVETVAKSGGYNCHRRQFMLMTVPGPRRDEAGSWNSLQVSVEPIGHATICWCNYVGLPPLKSQSDATPLYTVRFNPTMATPSVDPAVYHANSSNPRPMALVRDPWSSTNVALCLHRVLKRFFKMSF